MGGHRAPALPAVVGNEVSEHLVLGLVPAPLHKASGVILAVIHVTETIIAPFGRQVA